MAELLELREVGKSFGGLRAVDSVSFAMREGTIHAVIGPNGAGKTTLFNLICGALKPDSGAIAFNGKDITGLYAHRIARLGILRTFQGVKLSPQMSVAENVMLGMHGKTKSGILAGMLTLPSSRRDNRRMREKALECLRQVGLERLADAKTGGLPFGNQRMVELARCLAGDPKLLLLDEPASGLNMAETRELTVRISAVRARGMSVLLVEHDMSLVMGISDRLTVLNFGQKIAEGGPKEIQADPEVIRIYLGEDDD
jgi:branched-chain amino acid transport system ATP-binding protein